MVKLYTVLFLLIYSPCIALAQYNLNENKTWAFPTKLGINFNSGSAALTATAIEGSEASASVSDASGNLLFYTNGIHVWDRNHNQMPNATTANPLHPYTVGQYPYWEVTASTTQGALIVENIGNPGKYYLFSLTEFEPQQPHPGRLFYSMIDMSLRSGLGDVVTGQKWIPIDTALTEKMIGVPGDNCDIWVLVHGRDANVFKAYRITSAGIDPNPVLSHSGVSGSKLVAGFPQVNAFWMLGEMKISPDRRKLAITNEFGEFTELHDFDPSTGIVSGGVVVDTSNYNSYSGTGVAFSPDGTKLYVSDIQSQPNPNIPHNLYQFDVTVPTRAAITGSKTLVLANSGTTGLRLAPDGKIYFYYGPQGTKNISAINNPNQVGLVCNPQTNVFSQTSIPNSQYWSMGNEYVKAMFGKDVTGSVRIDTTICVPFAGMQLKVTGGDSGYVWNDGATDSVRNITQRGKYWVTYKHGCRIYVDTFVIGGKDSLDIKVDLGNDTILCGKPFPYLLDAGMSMSATDYLWQDGSTHSTYAVMNAGNYWVKVGQQGCFLSDTINIGYFDVDASLGSDKIICNEQQVLLHVDKPAEGVVLWNDGSTGSTLTVTHTGDYWAMVTVGPCIDRDTVHVSFVTLQMSLGRDTSVCIVPFHYELLATVTSDVTYRWSDGSIDTSFVVAKPGVYWLTVAKDGCSINDTIQVDMAPCNCIVELPDAFTPNSDGLNDIFRIIKSKNCFLADYSLQLYNRWGQKVFETQDATIGWDGNYKGEPADLGVYGYQLSYTIIDTGVKKYSKGSMTLIR